MADLERTYNVPLRKEFQKAPPYKRAKKAIKALKEFLVKNMKSENVLLGPKVNEKIWEKGIKNPPHHVKITAIKNPEGEVRAELFGFEFKKKQAAKKKEKKKSGLMGKLQEKVEEAKGGKEETAEKKEKKEMTENKEKTETKEAVKEKPAENKEDKPAKEPKAAVKKEKPKAEKKEPEAPTEGKKD